MIAAADDMGRHTTLIHDGSRREATETQARNYGLPTESFCEFVLNLPSDAILIGFYFSYDSVKGCADLSLNQMQQLSNEDFIPQEEYERRVLSITRQFGFTTDYVHKSRMVSTTSTVFGKYLIEFTPRKWLKIRDLEAGRELVRDKWTDNEGKIRYAKPEWRWRRSVTVWDVFGFFQKSFIRALKDYRCAKCTACKASPQEHCLTAPWSPDDLDRIESMKASRGVFDPSQQKEIEQYCISECEYLAFLFRDLLVNISDFENGMLKLKGYHGSGAAAQAWLTAKNIKVCLPIRTMEMPSDGILPTFYLSGLPEIVALSAYFGGRFEISEIGYLGTMYSYDINSAYPAITVSLPCLAHGRFVRVSEYVPGRVGVYLAGSHTSGRFAPFPFRTDSTGAVPGVAKDAIYYCHGGQRWIWHDEIAMARKHFGTDNIPIYDGWIWEPDGCDCNPFKDVPHMYKLRQQYVIDGNGIEKVIKLILNSLYGKFAQSLGWEIYNNEKIPPPFQCFIWAGIITSGCRAMIMNAFMQPDADVVSIATDGILSRTPIKSLPCPKVKELGKWDYGQVDDVYLFQSGVYTYTSVDKHGNRKRTYKTRGFAPKEISAEQLIAAYFTDEQPVKANPNESRFVTMKSAAGSDERAGRADALEYIGQWIPSEHDVSFTHNRRLPVIDFDNGDPDFGAFVRHSEPHTVPDDMQSAPYEPKQTWEDVMENQPVSDEADYQMVDKL
jgi:hypothetical protein